MASILDVFGFGGELRTGRLILRIIAQPGRYLSQPLVGNRELVAIVALVWRLLILVKLIELFPWTRTWVWRWIPYYPMVLVLLFLAAFPLARFALYINAPLLNLIVKKIGGKDDIAAAKRAQAFAAIFPNPFLCLYVFNPILAKVFNPLIATFVFYGICGAAGTLLDWLALSKAYRLSWKRSILLATAPTLLTMFILFQIPFYLSDRFSPRIVKDDVDVSILDFHRFPLDSSRDGSEFLKRDLLASSLIDSALLDSVYRKKEVPDRELGRQLEEDFRKLKPLLAATYFDKAELDHLIPDFPMNDEAKAVSVEYSFRVSRYGKTLVLYTAYCLSAGGFADADSTIKETMEFVTALGQSNLGLVNAIHQSLIARRISDLLAVSIPHLSDPRVAIGFAAHLAGNLVDQECLLNAFRLEYNQLETTMRISEARFQARLQGFSDAAGYRIPGYTVRKFLDLEDSHVIHSHIWAKLISAARIPSRDPVRDVPEVAELKGVSTFAGAFIYKNSIGRLVLRFSTPLYQSYANSVLDNRRYMESVCVALLLKARWLETGAEPTLADLPSYLRFPETLAIRGDSLSSADSLRFKEIFAIPIR